MHTILKQELDVKSSRGCQVYFLTAGSYISYTGLPEEESSFLLEGSPGSSDTRIQRPDSLTHVTDTTQTHVDTHTLRNPKKLKKIKIKTVIPSV